MDPQLQSILTSVGLAAATSAGAWAVSKGIISQGDQSAFANQLVLVVSGLITAGLAWWKARQVSQTSMIKSVNAADNGVTVVPTTPATAPLKVDAPLK